MISKKMEQMLNDQIRKEFYSSYLYLSMRTYFESLNLDGFANFFSVQEKEERDHAMKIFDYVNYVGGKVSLQQIDAPKNEFNSMEEVFSLSLEHEKYVTKSIYDIVDLAIEERDHKTNAFLQWFVNEQAEEENTFEAILSKVKLVGKDPNAILMLDAELAKRVHTPIAQEE